MRRLVIGGLVAAVSALSMACAQAIKTVEVTPDSVTKRNVVTMPLEFHDPGLEWGGCKLVAKPARFEAHYGDIVVWQIKNGCNYRIDACVVGFFRDDTTVPDPLEDVDDQGNPVVKRRCDRIAAQGEGRIRTRVRPDTKGSYEYTILRRRRDRDWKIVDPMIDIVP